MSTNNNQCFQISSYYGSITIIKRASVPLYVVIYLWMPSIAYVTDLSAPVLITFKTLNPFLSCSSICGQTVLDTVQICSFWLLTCVITNSYLFSGFLVHLKTWDSQLVLFCVYPDLLLLRTWFLVLAWSIGLMLLHRVLFRLHRFL